MFTFYKPRNNSVIIISRISNCHNSPSKRSLVPLKLLEYVLGLVLINVSKSNPIRWFNRKPYAGHMKSNMFKLEVNFLQLGKPISENHEHRSDARQKMRADGVTRYVSTCVSNLHVVICKITIHGSLYGHQLSLMAIELPFFIAINCNSWPLIAINCN